MNNPTTTPQRWGIRIRFESDPAFETLRAEFVVDISRERSRDFISNQEIRAAIKKLDLSCGKVLGFASGEMEHNTFFGREYYPFFHIQREAGRKTGKLIREQFFSIQTPFHHAISDLLERRWAEKVKEVFPRVQYIEEGGQSEHRLSQHKRRGELVEFAHPYNRQYENLLNRIRYAGRIRKRLRQRARRNG